MLNQYAALFPEAIIIIGLVSMWLVRIFDRHATSKTFCFLSRSFMVLAVAATGIFYNQSVPPYLFNNMFTLLFKILIYAFTFVWSYLSFKHFAAKNTSGFAFYQVLLFNLLCFSVAISTHNLLLLFAGLSLQFLANNIYVYPQNP